MEESDRDPDMVEESDIYFDMKESDRGPQK
jgi:hypothetical protein